MSTEEESNPFINALRELIRPIAVVATTLRLFFVDDDTDNDAAATPSNFFLFNAFGMT